MSLRCIVRRFLMKKELSLMIKNATFLVVLKGVSYVIPVFLFGYLVKALSVEGFGKYSIALAICAYAQVVVDYGFSLTASREVARQQDSILELSRIYFETTIVKVILAVVVYPVYYVSCLKLIDDSSLLMSTQIAYAIVVGGAFFPGWFFQGIEKLGFVVVVDIFCKVVSFLMVFVFVEDEGDVAVAILVQAVPLMMVSILCNILILSKYVDLCCVNLTAKGLFCSLKDGWSIFVSSIASVMLTNSATLILSSTTTTYNVGLYSAAEKLAKAINGVFAPITQAIYPYNCRQFSKSLADGLFSVKKTGVPLIIFAGFLLVLIYVLSDYVGFFFNISDESVLVFNILLVWSFFGVVNNVLGIQVLCASSNGGVYSRSFVSCAFLSVALIYVLCVNYALVGAAIAITIGEMFLSLFFLHEIFVRGRFK